MNKKRILFVISEDWALISHRLHLVEYAIAKGFEVGLATRITKYENILEEKGVKLFRWNLERRSLNPIREVYSVFNLNRILRVFKPDIIHAVAQKPIIYAGFANKFSYKSSLIANLGGIGYVFTSESCKAKLLKPIVIFLLKYVLSGNKTRLILQNNDNINTIKKLNIIQNNYIRLVKGAGVEIEKFLPSSIPKGIPIVILPGRMLRDKGVFEFSRVAQKINSKVRKALFVIVGEIDKHNPETLHQYHIDNWVESGILEHWGRREDMEKVYAKTSIVCLPSYNEGLPKVLIEAASCGRPIIAFDVPGCREVIEHGLNGFLINFRDENQLEKYLTKLIDNKKLCEQMGKNGRKIVENKFSSQIINNQTFSIWKE